MEQSSSQPSPAPEAPAAPPMSLAGRLFNVFAAPGEVFDDILPRPVDTANWLVPALILVAVGWLGTWLILSQSSIHHQLGEITEQAIQKQAQSHHMSEQQMEQARQAAEKWVGISTMVGGVVMSVLAAFGVPFFWGLILWLVGDSLMQGGFSYMKAVEVVGLANMIIVLDSVLRTLLVVVMGNLYASASPAMFVKNFNPQNTLHALLLYINVMTFWLLAVRAVGLARLARTSFVKAALWVFGMWIAYNGFFFGLSLAVQAMLKRAVH